MSQSMKSYLSSLLVVLGASLLTGCAGTWQIVPVADQVQKSPGPGLARICVMRPARFMGGKYAIVISDSFSDVGELGVRGYLCWDRPCGDVQVVAHPLRVRVVNQYGGFMYNAERAPEATLNLSLEEGKTYYVRYRIIMGWWHNNAELVPLSEEEGRHEQASCSPAKYESSP